MYRLVFLTGSRKGRRLTVQQGDLLIGRAHDVQLDLREDDEVSHHHALLEKRDDGYYLKDLGGLNPALVNGQPVRGVIKLKHDDQIEIGKTLMQFHVVEAAASSARRTAGPLQLLTFSLLGLLLLGQLAYWLIFPRLHQAPLPAAEPAKRPEAAEPRREPEAAPPDSLQAELERAIAQAKAEERSPDFPLPAAVPLPAPPPAPIATITQDMRAVMADLRKQVEELAAVATNLTPHPPAPAPATGAPPVIAAEPAPPTPEELLLARAKAQLTSALAQEQQGNLVEADARLERLQALAPDFVPAYVERARLYEKRGMLTKAGEQWTQVLNRSTGTPLYDQASAERARLARAEIMLTMSKPPPRTGDAAGESLPRAIRIVSIERERFEASSDYDEMRIVRVTLQPKPSEGTIEVDQVSITATFYDRNEATGKIRPTRAVAPTEPLRVEGLWRSGEQKAVTAAYIVPRDFRRDEKAKHGAGARYEGVRIRVFYHGHLQDEEATPRTLLTLPAPGGES